MTVHDFFLAAGADNVPVEGIRAGTIAVWRGASKTDFDPAIDPLNHIADLRFHSDFDYPRGVGVVKSTDPGRSAVTIGATGSDAVINRSDVLFAHGMSPPPLIIAMIEVGGYRQPLAGSMTPLPGGNINNTNWRICSIAVDDTNVMLRTRGGYAPAMTIHWEVLLLQEAFQVRSEGDFMIYLDPAEIDGAQVGKVSSEYRFLSEAEDPAFRVLGGKQTISGYDISDGETGWIIPTNCSAWTNATSFIGWFGADMSSTHLVGGVEVEP